MMARPRGRPKRAKVLTAGKLEDLSRIAEAWERHRKAQLNAGLSPKAARGAATTAMAKELSRTPTRVRQLLKRYRSEAEPLIQRMIRAIHDSDSSTENVRAAKALVTPEEGRALDEMPMRAGYRLADRLVRGAAAESENKHLKDENKKLQAQLSIWRAENKHLKDENKKLQAQLSTWRAGPLVVKA